RRRHGELWVRYMRHSMIVLLALVSVALVGACSTAPPPAEAGRAEARQVVGHHELEGGADAPDPSGVVGHWSSPSCGPRTYERRLTLDASGSFSSEELISPCPRGVVCVWSGILILPGTYTVEAGEIVLDLRVARPSARPFPSSLAIDTPSGTLVETSSDGD